MFEILAVFRVSFYLDEKKRAHPNVKMLTTLRKEGIMTMSNKQTNQRMVGGKNGERW
jgi:hypothetical protein